jgi:hypothetical protein
MGITGRELAERFNCTERTISYYKWKEAGGVPAIKIELLHDTELPSGELLKAGVYTAHDAGKQDELCLHSVATNRLHFLKPNVLYGDIRLLSLSGEG